DGQLQENLHKLDAASERPWVLLSAGVDFPDYKRQVEMAMKSGASGVLGGRAFWKEFFAHEGQEAQERFARQESAARVKQIDDVVQKHGTPWFARYNLTADDFARVRVAENWHFRYGDNETPMGTPVHGADGEVY